MTLLYLLIILGFGVHEGPEVEGLSGLCGTSSCVQGDCEAGICKCSACYTGSSCNLMDNSAPLFEKSYYHVTILRKPSVGEVLIKVSAKDKDIEKFARNMHPCNTIIYSILDDKNKGIFEIDSATGEVKLAKQEEILDSEYSIDVRASNKSPFDNIYDTTTISINFGKLDTKSDERISRFKRATAPTTLNFALAQIYPATSINVTQIGQLLTFTLTITFPIQSTPMTVELFAPEATAPVMMLCSAYVSSIGSLLTGSITIGPPFYDTMAGVTWPYTRVTYQISSQNHNNPTPSNLADIQAVITFNTYMLYSNKTPDATLYYVSAGAEYLNSTQIWVGQSGYTTSIQTPAPTPTITLVGDTAAYPDSTAAFDLVIYAPGSYVQLNMEFYSPLNDTTLMSICLLARYYVGLSYSCLPANISVPTTTSITVNSKKYYPTGQMNVGLVTNQQILNSSATGTDKDTIKVKLALRINPLAWVGGNSYVGVAVSYSLTNIITIQQPLPILAKPPKTPYTTPVNAVLDFYCGSTAMIGSVTQLSLNIIMPQNVELDLTILASFQTLNSEICGFNFSFVGSNIPCMDQVELKPTFTMSSDNYQVWSKLTIPNVRNVAMTNGTDVDILKILIAFRPINDARNADGNNILSNITLNWNGGTSGLMTNTFTLQAPLPPANISISNLPTFTFGFIGSDGNISVNDAKSLLFTIMLVPGIVYTPVTLEFYMPFNVTARMKLCQATITYVGKNVFCFDKNVITSRFIYSSRVNDTSTYDKLSIPIGSLCNGAIPGTSATLSEQINIQLDVLVLPHSMNLVNTQTSLNAGMLLTATQIWVGTQNINFVTAVTPPALTGSAIPVIYGSRVDNASNLIWANDMAIFQYIIKIAGNSTASLSLQISSDITTTDNFGVCNVTILQKGNSIPCVITTPSTTTWYTNSKFVKTFTLQFTTIINSGITPIANPSFDDNSILVEAIVKFGSTLPATFNVKALLTYNTGTVPLNFPLTYQSALIRFNGTLIANQPQFSFVLMPLFNTSTPNVSIIGYGEALRAILTVQLIPASIQALTILFINRATTTNQMDIASVNVLSVGMNIPCLKPGMGISVVTSRSGSSTQDMNSLALGTVCQRTMVGSTLPTDNTIVIEAIFRIWKIPTGNPTELDINAIGLVNNDQIYVTKINFNVGPSITQITPTNLLNLNVSINATLSTSTLLIGKNVTLNASVCIPPYSQFNSGVIKLYSPLQTGSDSALFVSDNTNFTATFGPNVVFNVNENFPMNSISSMNTSQKDTISVNFGVTQNPATTYRMGPMNYTGQSPNDIMTVQFNIRVTDHLAASNGATFDIIVAAEFDSIKINTSIPITISRTNLETIAINATTTLLSNKTAYTSSDEITISASASLINGSQLECRNFSIQVAAPSFITLTTIKNSSYTSPGFSIQQSSYSPGGFSFNVPYFFVLEQISVTFGMILAPGTTLTKLRQMSITNIPIIYGCKTLNWASNPQGNQYIYNVTGVKFQVMGQPIIIAGCNNNLQVTDSAVIPDCSISAYLSPYVGFGPLKIRSNSGAMWKPHTRGGVYAKFRFISIILQSVITVTRVIITSTSPNPPQEVSIYGTMDGRSYSFYLTSPLVFNGSTAEVGLSNPGFNYMGIRIAITKTLVNDSDTGLNIDLYGCPNPNVTSLSLNACTQPLMMPLTSMTNYYSRGFLYVAPNMFVCDDIPTNSMYLETYPRCYRSYDTSLGTWLEMGPYVGKVIGYDINNKYIYGIGSDLKSYVMSQDDGLTWININQGGWLSAQILGSLSNATEVPWTIDVGFNPNINGTQCTKFVTGVWNFCYDGVYNAGVKLLSWNNCCGS